MPAIGMPESEIGMLFECMTYASRPLRDTAEDLTQQYGLGPRGVHILAVIDNGADYPVDIAKTFDVSRSLITSELNHLLDAELIEAQQSKQDRRRTNLSLTPKGRRVLVELRAEIHRLFEAGAKGFTRSEILTCIRVLRAFRAVSGAVSDALPKDRTPE